MISKKNYINLSGTKIVNKLNDLTIGNDINDLMVVNSESKIEGELNVMKTTNLRSDLNVNGDKFNVKSDTGNTDIKGKLDVTNITNLKGDVVIGEVSSDLLVVNSGAKFTDNVDVKKKLTTGEIDTSKLTVHSNIVVTGSTVTGITKEMVSGIENVNNTSDHNKPLSIQSINELALKAPIANPTFTGSLYGLTGTAGVATTIYSYGWNYHMTFTHGNNGRAYFFRIYLQCILAINGWAVGDRISAADAMDGDWGRNYNVEITTSNFIIRGDYMVLTKKNNENQYFLPTSSNFYTYITWLKVSDPT